jgi:hypothetical protein
MRKSQKRQGEPQGNASQNVFVGRFFSALEPIAHARIIMLIKIVTCWKKDT